MHLCHHVLFCALTTTAEQDPAFRSRRQIIDARYAERRFWTWNLYESGEVRRQRL